MKIKGIFIIILVVLAAILACSAVSATDNIVVWADNRDGGDNHIYYKNLETGDGVRVNNTNSYQNNPYVSGNLVVWEDDRDGDSHIFYKNLNTGSGGRVSNTNSKQSAPYISDNIVVWVDGRDVNPHIYYKNLATGSEGKVSIVDSNQHCPTISGNMIVWSDDRDGKYHIYYKNLATCSGGRVSNTDSSQYNPNISGNIVIWVDDRDGCEEHIYFKNIATGSGGRVSNTNTHQWNPRIANNIVTWEDKRDGKSRIYYKNLSTGSGDRICDIDSIQENQSISGNLVIWQDFRNSGSSQIYYKNLSTGSAGRVSIDSSEQYLWQGDTAILPGEIGNINTGKNYFSIQTVIDDILTLNGHTLLANGTFKENIIISKSLTIMPVQGSNVTIQALNTSNPIFTLNCNSSIIQGFTIRGNTNSDGIYLSGSSYNTIQNNTIKYNGKYGIRLIYHSNNNMIQNNTITDNGLSGIYTVDCLSNIIQNNTITDNIESGIHIYSDPSNGCELYSGSSNGNIYVGSNGSSILNSAILKNPTDNNAALLELMNNNIMNNVVQNNIITNNNGNGIDLENTSNNLVQNNTLKNNSECGVYISYNKNNIINNNIITNNKTYGVNIYSVSTNNLVQNNNISSNTSGMLLYCGSSGYNLIRYNTIVNNQNYGIKVSGYSDADINLNRITGNGKYGIYGYETGSVNTNNNWWGTNNPIFSSVYGSHIYIDNNTINYNPWLVLNISSKTPSNANKDYTVMADLTHNNQGNDTSPQGTIPDGTPVNFFTNFGTIQTTVYINKGKSVSILNSNTNGIANVTVTLDNQTDSKTVNLGVYNEITQTDYTSIQAAIHAASSGDTIGIYNGTYKESIIINKKINFTGNGANPLLIGTITINQDSNGTLIQNLTIHGTINLNANNCTIYENTITGNGAAGIIISDSTDNLIAYNKITSVGYDGIRSISSSNQIIKNDINGSISGIYSENSNNTIKSNNIVNNYNGIWTHNSTDTIQFNRITGNNYGLKNEIGTVNATNNWWGKNPIFSSSSPSDIYNSSGTVNYNPYLILTVNASSTNSGGNASVTADLTQNNQDADTSSQGHIPNGIPVNFVTNYGTIVNTAYTIKGQAVTVLNLNSLQPQNVTVSASLDNQSISTTGIVSMGSAVLNIKSTAIDNSKGQPLNITYNIPLNESVTWLSILWTPTTIPDISALAEELQIIIDGNIVLDKYIYNNNGQNIDDLIFNLSYPGIAGFNITITDPNNQITNLNFPGNVINRTSKISYTGNPYEGVHCFAIATTKVTKELVNYWLNQYSLYLSPGGMSDAYATFMTSLLVEYAHDLIAESLSSEFNVKWSRTNPIIVSSHQDLYEVYLTLDCDHIMGMTAVGTPSDLWSFNYITSLSISPIEYAIMNGVTNSSYQSNSANREFSSVVADLLKYYSINNTTVESFLHNNYLIIRTVNNYDYIVIDLETGIARDINTINNFCGSTATYEITPIFGFSVTGTPHIGYPIDWFGNPWDLGIINFYWDGSGKIFLASSPYAVNPYTDQIGAMGEILVKSTFGTTSFNPEKPEDTWKSGPALEVTQILMPGVENTINVLINASGTRHGCSTLWLIQVITKPLNRPINTTDITDFTKDPTEDSKWYKIYELGTGITEIIAGMHFWLSSDDRENTIYFQKVGNDLIDKGWDRVKNVFN